MNQKAIEELVTRSVSAIYPSQEALSQVLMSDTKLRVYMGIDPTAPYVHLGHSTNYILLKRFHELGHKIIVLVGNFTAMVGDPSDKTSARVQLTQEEIASNIQTYREQIGKILPLDDKENPIEFVWNADWLAKLSFTQLVDLASNFTVQQMIERDMFEKRLEEGKPLYVHEFFYPLMQGYDSVAISADVEIGGTDQTFNMLAGRTLVKRYQNREKFVIATTLLANPKTGEKLMSKSLGTGVGINEEPREMFAKTMKLPDEGIVQTYIDCTYKTMGVIAGIQQRLDAGENPRTLKIELAREIVTMYHSAEMADDAERYFESIMTQGVIPQDAPTAPLAGLTVVDALVAAGLAESKSEARRLVSQKGIRHNGVVCENDQTNIAQGDTLERGKGKVVRAE